MRICGIEIKGLDAVIALLEFNNNIFTIPDCRFRKIEFNKQNRTTDLQYFQKTFAKLVEDYKIDRVVIRERFLKGKFAGGALGFKMEASIQLIHSLDVELISSNEIKALIKQNPLPIDFSETGLKIFQQPAFDTAYAGHMRIQYPSKT